MPKRHARRRAKKSKRKMCKLTIVNKAGDVVAEGVTPESFAAFKKQQRRGSAVLVELDCGEILVDTVRLLRRFPRGAEYKARLLLRVAKPPANLNATGHAVWAEV